MLKELQKVLKKGKSKESKVKIKKQRKRAKITDFFFSVRY